MNSENNICQNLDNYIKKIITYFDSVTAERKAELRKISAYISDKLNKGENAKLIFICTHNSRRSHMAQLWAQAAAYYFNIPQIFCYSGGTEATAFYPASVNALRSAGFDIETTETTSNPVYHVKYANDMEHISAFSKKYDDLFNPQQGFAAIMVCSHADEACPIVYGAEARFFLPYEDPKVADNTTEEELKYGERSRQIATEMFHMISKTK